MSKITIGKSRALRGLFYVPGDKSIAHRALVIGSISEGITEIEGLPDGLDVDATINCLREVGVKIEKLEGGRVIVYGVGLRGLKRSETSLDCNNSGTTMRLLAGLFAGQNSYFSAVLTGDISLSKRPMLRIIKPLNQMGADITGNNGLPPLQIRGSQLTSLEYTMKVASAQVKSSILLASLCAGVKSVIHEPCISRNHTEIMLNYFGADVISEKNTITINPIKSIRGKKIGIAGDFSQAAYFMGAALIVPGSDIIITNVNINFSRIGLVSVLREMGAKIDILARRNLCEEPVADISVKYSSLSGTTVQGEIIPRLIDEIPILAVIALFAEGITIVKDAAELRVKESDRIKAIVSELKKFGADIKETPDGFVIVGKAPLKPANVFSYGDHRIAMSLAVLALTVDGNTVLNGYECVDVSFPNFFNLIPSLELM